MFFFQNLLEKPEEKKNEAALSMIQCKLLPVSKQTVVVFSEENILPGSLFTLISILDEKDRCSDD